MSDDLVYTIKMPNPTLDLNIDDFHVQQMVLFELDHLLKSYRPSRSVVDFHLPKPDGGNHSHVKKSSSFRRNNI